MNKRKLKKEYKKEHIWCTSSKKERQEIEFLSTNPILQHIKNEVGCCEFKDCYNKFYKKIYPYGIKVYYCKKHFDLIFPFQKNIWKVSEYKSDYYVNRLNYLKKIGLIKE